MKKLSRLCQKLFDFGAHNERKKNFFYQSFNDYWDGQNRRFQFGPHLNGWMWNEKGECIIGGVGNIPEDIRLI
jgi:hypothetical protein